MFAFSRKLTTFCLCLSITAAASSALASDSTSDYASDYTSNSTKDKDFGTLRPFATDGCTDFPNGTPDHPELWLDCCVHHDLLYWAGGTRKEKLHADEFLFHCVSSKGEPVVAAIMFAGVTVGGTPYIKDASRWGYGWPKLRGFHPLSEDELEQVKQLTPQSVDQIIEQLSN